MMLQQIPRRVIHLRNRQLKIDLRLNQVQLRLRELRLRIQHKENLLRPQFILSFVGMQRFFGKIHGHLGRFHP